ncbi:MAG: nucleotidyl transferase AbiEii/AbiGii toxin family protein [Parachlamydiales bacterium]
MAYPGAQVVLLASLGGTKTRVQVDLGFGDRVDPVDQSIELTRTPKGPLFESEVQLLCYPKEFIFAEKLETVVYRGGGNSRMKDFHDLYSLISEPNFLDVKGVSSIIQGVFQHRNTSLGGLPIQFEPKAGQQISAQWTNYHKELLASHPHTPVPSSFEEVVTHINKWLDRHLYQGV